MRRALPLVLVVAGLGLGTWCGSPRTQAREVAEAGGLFYVVQPPRTAPPAGRGAPVLVLLHGLGADERDLLPLAAGFDGRFVVASVRAPLARPGGGYSWFPVEFHADGPVADAAAAEESRLRLLALLDVLARRPGVDPRRVYLVGFSQGAILASSVLLSAPEKVAGIVALSGRILPEAAARPAPPGARGKPVLVVHGQDDRVIPVALGREARRLWQARGVALTYKEVAGGHGIPAETSAAVAAWLGEQLAAVR